MGTCSCANISPIDLTEDYIYNEHSFDLDHKNKYEDFYAFQGEEDDDVCDLLSSEVDLKDSEPVRGWNFMETSLPYLDSESFLSAAVSGSRVQRSMSLSDSYPSLPPELMPPVHRRVSSRAKYKNWLVNDLSSEINEYMGEWTMSALSLSININYVLLAAPIFKLLEKLSIFLTPCMCKNQDFATVLLQTWITMIYIFPDYFLSHNLDIPISTGYLEPIIKRTCYPLMFTGIIKQINRHCENFVFCPINFCSLTCIHTWNIYFSHNYVWTHLQYYKRICSLSIQALFGICTRKRNSTM